MILILGLFVTGEGAMNLESVLTFFAVLSLSLLIGFIPATYLGQLLEGDALGRRRREVRRLGLPGLFEPAPRPLPNARTYGLAILLAVLAVSVGVLLAGLLLLSALTLAGLAVESPLTALLNPVAGLLRAVFFGFIGAYLFSIQMVARRYREGDLDPQAYFTVVERIITAMIISGMLGLTFPAFSGQRLGAILEAAVYVISFTVGIFPEWGEQWLTSRGLQLLRLPRSKKIEDAREFPLTRLPGINTWQAVRLNLAGIDNIASLADADIQELLRQTQFGVQQIYDWVDQAILYIHVTEERWACCQALILRGLTDFQSVYADPQLRGPLADKLGLSLENLQILSQAMAQTANGNQVQLFWKYNTARATDTIRFNNLGQAYLELKEYDKAIDNLDQALRYSDNDPRLYATRGDAWRLKGEFQKAIEDYDQSLQLDAQAADVRYTRGQAHMSMAHYERAAEDFRRASSLDNRNPAILNSLGLALQKQNKLDEAAENFGRAITLDASFAEAWDNRGEAYRVQRPKNETPAQSAARLEQALADLQRALELNPRLATAYYHLGLLRRGMKMLPEALSAFSRALTEQSDMALAYNARGLIYQDQQNLAQAIDDFSSAIRYDPNYAEAYNNRGIARRLAGDLLLSYQDHTRAIELDARYKLAYLNRGITRLAARQPRDALRDFDKVIALEPSAVALNNRGLAYQALDELRIAQADYDRAIGLDPNYADAYNNRGKVRAILGQYDQAIQDYDQALKLVESGKYPSLVQSADIYLNRGNACLDRSDYEAAAQNYEQAISLRYESSLAHLNRGYAFVGMKRWEDALESFKKATEVDPQNANAFYGWAQMAARLQRMDEAQAALKQAVSLNKDYRTSAKADEYLSAVRPPDAPPAPQP